MESEANITHNLTTALKFVSGDEGHICRLCFAATENEGLLIYDTVFIDKPYIKESLSLMDMFARLGVYNEPELPNTVCKDCGSLIVNSYLFKELCEYSNKQWTEAVNKLQNSLRHSTKIKPKSTTAYIVIDEEGNNIYFKKRKNIEIKNKSKLLSEIRNIKANQHNNDLVKVKQGFEEHHEDINSNKPICAKCNKTYKHKDSLRKHLKICGIDPSLICDACGKKFGRKIYLAQHLAVQHNIGSKVSCKWCGKKFYSHGHQLKMHILKHTKEKNFHCEECGGKFVTKTSLLYHTRIHTGEKPYPCDMCNKSFLSASRRMDHKRINHLAPTRECRICFAKFSTKFKLLRHVQRHSNPKSGLFVPDLPTFEENE